MHIADVHLDSAMSAHLSNEKRNERRAELLASFVRLVEAAKTEKVKAVLISGDLFDTGKVKSGTAKTVMNAISNNVIHNKKDNLPEEEIVVYYRHVGGHKGKGKEFKTSRISIFLERSGRPIASLML